MYGLSTCDVGELFKGSRMSALKGESSRAQSGLPGHTAPHGDENHKK